VAITSHGGDLFQLWVLRNEFLATRFPVFSNIYTQKKYFAAYRIIY